ncbi:MAG TPA: hypothetical protein VF306_01820 [Pirellulales bacterium]
MYIAGEWHPCDDGVLRPVVRAEVLSSEGHWVHHEFLLDVGADRTVLTAAALRILELQAVNLEDGLAGIGGSSEAVGVESKIRFTDDRGGKVIVQGQFAAVRDLESLDICVLGRDVTNNFGVIVDRPGDRVCMIAQPDRYSIVRG